MSSDEVAIRVRGVSKHYFLYGRPEDRLKQSIVPRLQRLVGRPPAKYYRDFAALHGVSFEIRRGETVGIVGRNGSGKSTLLQIVCGTLQPSAGTVEINGRIAALLELGAGFNPEFTGRENVYLNAAIMGLSRAEIDQRFEDIARFADIGQFIEQPVKTYSSGMYVRLAFATAINVDPDILVVDEALAVGDEAFQRKCFARIEDIQGKGGTILFVSHGAQTVVQLCSRAMLIDAGELILEGRPKMVVSQYQRLVNASPQAAADIRASIAAFDGAAPQAEIAATAEEERQHGAGDEQLTPAQAAPVAPRANGAGADYHDPSLVSQTAIYMEERGARIRDVRILTLDGRRVNVLQMGRRYVLEYLVDFSVDVESAGFGMQLRTVHGMLIAGGHTSKVRSLLLKRIEANTTSQIRFEFSCLLVPDTYFAACGVRGVVDGAEGQLHRIIDVLLFRVAPETGLIATGRCDFGVVPTIGLQR